MNKKSALKRATEKLLSLSPEEFSARLEKHKNSPLAKLLQQAYDAGPECPYCGCECKAIPDLMAEGVEAEGTMTIRTPDKHSASREGK